VERVHGGSSREYRKKMTFGDAVLLREAENYDAEAIITWNTKNFGRRTRRTVLSPTAFLRQLKR
jgi:hypothetical protein